MGWLVGWFKRYILLGPRAGALTLLQGIWGPVDLFRGAICMGLRTEPPQLKQKRQKTGMFVFLVR